ncbi:MAG: phosphoribosylformylglycinamidine synthase subunit PurL [Chloroflexi bacterium]|nr:phosphoribosylformylglycinamidine synthase subunit PurL [Chloroflexota bacterium]
MLSRHPVPVPVFRIDVMTEADHRRRGLKEQIRGTGYRLNGDVEVREVYFLQGVLTEAEVREIAQTLVLDPVTQRYTQEQLNAEDGVEVFNCIEVVYKPGVTDSAASQLLEAAHQMGITALLAARTGLSYRFDEPVPEDVARSLAYRLLANATVQDFAFGEIRPEFIHPVPGANKATIVPIKDLNALGLQALSSSHRLSLNLKEMQAIQAYYCALGREPTDAELETIAQTWSEHCLHKTFKADIFPMDGSEPIRGLIKTYIQAATTEINAPWVRSAFVDNAGVIEFDEEFDLSFKVETHNHPSAIEPFGGANTGVGGVVRDILGVSHRPIAVTDVLCFGPQDLADERLPTGVLHPRRIQAGVVHGIADYGNKLGLPTVNGSIHYHSGFSANPLVCCGCVGIGPRGSHPRSPRPGDRVIVLGGATGRDGLRGATFSSQVMDAGSGEVAGASVQIGDPITEKGLLEVVERARDAQLYSAITDCGAGGLSSAVGEMAAQIGVSVDLAHVPLKYPGLAPWEIWLSEAQERMVLAVPERNLPALRALCQTYWVALSNIGAFEETGRLRVAFGEERIVDLDNDFLHGGYPPLELRADFQLPRNDMRIAIDAPADLEISDEADMLLSLLRHPDIASKEAVARRYDHEVGGGTVIKPFVGPRADGPSDAAVLKPRGTRDWRGIALANGINPHYGEFDPYRMAISAVDEAIRNVVAVGADPERIALLDNFCWGNPNHPDMLGGLVRAAQGCHAAALHYQTPFISGKDSLYNEYVDESSERRAIPGTLLVSSIGIVPDIRNAVSMDLKEAGNALFLVGDWEGALAGSHTLLVVPHYFSGHPSIRQVPGLSLNAPHLYRALHGAMRAGSVRSAHDLSEGGLAVALAEMALAGRIGAQIDLSHVHVDPRLSLFAETNGCLLVEVQTERLREFPETLAGCSVVELGRVEDSGQLIITHDDRVVIDLSVDTLANAFTPQGQAE